MPLLPYHIPGKPGRLLHCLHVARDCIPGIVLPNSHFLLQIIILSPHSGPVASLTHSINPPHLAARPNPFSPGIIGALQ